MRRAGERRIAGKLTIRVGQRRLVLAKGAGESERHVLLKALVFARVVGEYPDVLVERSIGLRYKPDLVALGPTQNPRFWGECGETSRQKIGWLVRHVRGGHLVFARQGSRPDAFEALVAEAVRREPRHGLVELLFYGEDAWTAIADDGSVALDAGAPRVRRFPPGSDEAVDG